MATAEKSAAIAELTEHFRSSGAAVLTEYRGLSVAQITALRNTIREHATYAVVKNTLTRRAAAEAGVTGFDDHLQGPSAIAFITGDAVEVAKGLRDFAKANPALVIKAGLLDGRSMSPAEITKLADMQSREVLLARMAGAMNASLTQAVYLFAAPLSQAVRVVDALRAKVAEEGPAAAEAPADAAADATAESAPADTAAETPAESAPADAIAETPAESAPADDTAGTAPTVSVPDPTNDVAEGGDDS